MSLEQFLFLLHCIPHSLESYTNIIRHKTNLRSMYAARFVVVLLLLLLCSFILLLFLSSSSSPYTDSKAAVAVTAAAAVVVAAAAAHYLSMCMLSFFWSNREAPCVWVNVWNWPRARSLSICLHVFWFSFFPLHKIVFSAPLLLFRKITETISKTSNWKLWKKCGMWVDLTFLRRTISIWDFSWFLNLVAGSCVRNIGVVCVVLLKFFFWYKNKIYMKRANRKKTKKKLITKYI